MTSGAPWRARRARLRPGKRAAVHPRVRGAHKVSCWRLLPMFGPSPRARGSPPPPGPPVPVRGSIPACAGLTPGSGTGPGSGSVHPRVRGAHGRACTGRAAYRGPSPRARGSRKWRSPDSRVTGPSPRARGSPGRGDDVPAVRRSIPACAGLTVNDLGKRGALSPRYIGSEGLAAASTVACGGKETQADQRTRMHGSEGRRRSAAPAPGPGHGRGRGSAREAVCRRRRSSS